MLTANQELGAEIAKVFNALMLGETIEETNELLVAPKMMQNKIIEMIDNEIGKVTSGQNAYIGIKINSLTDKDIIRKNICTTQYLQKYNIRLKAKIPKSSQSYQQQVQVHTN